MQFLHAREYTVTRTHGLTHIPRVLRVPTRSRKASTGSPRTRLANPGSQRPCSQWSASRPRPRPSPPPGAGAGDRRNASRGDVPARPPGRLPWAAPPPARRVQPGGVSGQWPLSGPRRVLGAEPAEPAPPRPRPRPLPAPREADRGGDLNRYEKGKRGSCGNAVRTHPLPPSPARRRSRRPPRGARRPRSGQRLSGAGPRARALGSGSPQSQRGEAAAPRAPGTPRIPPLPDGPAAAMPDELTEPGRATPARASSFLIENLLAAEAKGAGRAAQGDGVREEEEDDDDPEDEDPEQARRRRLQRRRQLRAGSGPGGEARARALGLGPRPPPGPGPPFPLGCGGTTRWYPRAHGGYGGGLSPDSE